MPADAMMWLGMIGLIGGIMVGISLLEDEGDTFLRNVMLSAGVACVMFIYLLELGEKMPWSPLLFLTSLFVGGIAVLIIAFAAHGNLRAFFVAGGIGGVVLQVLVKVFPPGGMGITWIHDFPTAVIMFVTILVIAGVYYLLRNWGKNGERWD